MLKGDFQYGSENVEVIIRGNELFFYIGGTITTIEGLKFDKSGVIREFPDLKEDEEWKKKSIERLKEKMKGIETEKAKLDYIRDELVKFGYKALFWQPAGFRPRRFT